MICDDLFNCHPSCKLAQDLLDRNTGAFNYWFSEHYVRVNLNSVISFHHLLHALPLFVGYEGQFGSASDLLSVTFFYQISQIIATEARSEDRRRRAEARCASLDRINRMYRMITMQGSLKRPRDCRVPDMDIGLNGGVLRTEISLLISSPQGSHMHLLSDPCIKSTSLFFFYLVDPVKGSRQRYPPEKNYSAFLSRSNSSRLSS